MKKSYWGGVWESFKAVNGNLFAVVIFFIGIILIVATGIGWLSTALAILAAILILSNITFANFSYRLFLECVILPRVIRFECNKAKVICLTEVSKVFAYNSIVSMYYIRNGYEELIAVGEVYNIQEDGKIQIKIIELMTEKYAIEDKMKNNNTDFIKDLLVKPTIPKDLFC